MTAAVSGSTTHPQPRPEMMTSSTHPSATIPHPLIPARPAARVCQP